MKPEPFGYFKAEPCGWTDCHDDDDGAIPLYEEANQSPDSNVEAVREKLLQRSIVGLKKYGVTTERTDIDLIGWLDHIQMELMDACVYIESAKGKINDQSRSSENAPA